MRFVGAIVFRWRRLLVRRLLVAVARFSLLARECAKGSRNFKCERRGYQGDTRRNMCCERSWVTGFHHYWVQYGAASIRLKRFRPSRANDAHPVGASTAATGYANVPSKVRFLAEMLTAQTRQTIFPSCSLASHARARRWVVCGTVYCRSVH
jgi:hypothetical protein